LIFYTTHGVENENIVIKRKYWLDLFIIFSILHN